jgi:hypothetical protein
MEFACPNFDDGLVLDCLSYLKKLSLIILTQLATSNNRPVVLKSACAVVQKYGIIGNTDPQILLQ